MKTNTTYVFKTNDGAIGYSCGKKPTGVEIIEKQIILHPADGYILERISDKVQIAAVRLYDGDTKANYIEVTREERVPSNEVY